MHASPVVSMAEKVPRPCVLLMRMDGPRLQSLERLLKDEGYTVDIARDPEEADWRVQTAAYDAIVLSLRSGEKNGLELVQEWRRRCANAVLLILTARATSAERVKGFDLGAD